MATSVLFSGISAALNVTIADDVIRTFNAHARTVARLTKDRVVGQSMVWDAETTGAAIETFNDGDDVVNYSGDDIVKPVLALQGLRTNIRVGHQALATAANAGPAGLGKLFSRTIQNGMRKFGSVLNQAVFAGNGSFVGLSSALDITGLYAGVDRATVTQWRAKKADPGTPTALTLAQVRQDLSDIYDQCGEVPPLGTMDSTTFNKFAALFSEFRRINQQSGDRGPRTLDFTVDAIELDGCLFYKDKDCTANTIYYLNPNYIDIGFMPQVDRPGALPIRVDSDQGEFDIGLMYYDLGRNGAAERGTIEGFLQMAVRKPNAMGKRVNIL